MNINEIENKFNSKEEFEEYLNKCAQEYAKSDELQATVDFVNLEEIIKYHCFDKHRDSGTLRKKEIPLLQAAYDRFNDPVKFDKYIEEKKKELKLYVKLAETLLKDDI